MANSFSKVAGYIINSQNPVALLYTKDKSEEKETRKTSPSKVKYHWVTLTKQVEDLYDKNFMTLKKDIGDNIRRWKDLPRDRYSKNGHLTKW